LIGYVDGTVSSDPANQVFTVSLTSITSAGANYALSLKQPVEHLGDDTEDNLGFTVTVDVEDNDGSKAQTSFDVSFDDDTPTATLTGTSSSGSNLSETDAGGSTNLAFVLNVSDSVEGADGAISSYYLDLSASDGTEVLAEPDGGIYSGLMTTNQIKIYLYVVDAEIIAREGSYTGDEVFRAFIDQSFGEVSVILGTTGIYHDSEDTEADVVVYMSGIELDVVHRMVDSDGDVSEARFSLSETVGFEDGIPVVDESGELIAVPIENTAGAQTSGAVAFDGALDGIQSLTISGPIIEGIKYLEPTVADDGSVTLKAVTDDSDETEVFNIILQQDGSYTFTLVTPEASTEVPIGLITPVSSNAPTNTYIFEGADGSQIEVTGDSGSGDGLVNTSTNGLGVDSQNLDDTEVLIFNLDNRTLASGVTFAAFSAQGGDVLVEGYLNGTQVGSAIPVSILPDGDISADFTGVVDEIRLIAVDIKAKISSVTYDAVLLPNGASYDFTITATDGDGDTVTTSATVEILPQSTAPVALDLDRDGTEYLSREAGVVFTDQSTGDSVNTAWVGPDDGLLVIDANNSGTVDESREYVFTEWRETAETDMEAIAEVFDSNQDGVLDSQDDQWEQFRVWQDKDSDGKTDEGELVSLGDLMIESIDLTYVADSQEGTAADGDVVIHGQSAVTYTDGSTTIAEDTSFAISEADLLNTEELLLKEGAGDSVAAAPNADATNADSTSDLSGADVDLQSLLPKVDDNGDV
jgi:hypothetical protein